MKLIGICGYPTHGKSTAQDILELAGVDPRDDAVPLRRGACKKFGLTWEQVTTQQGKLEMCKAFGRTMTVRQALGDYGQVFERKYGERYWIDLALSELDDEDSLPAAVSFGSLRRSQPFSIKDRGGFVLGVIDPRKYFSKHEFDHFDYDPIDCLVINDGTIDEFAWRVLEATKDYLELTEEQVDEALGAFYRQQCMQDNTIV